MEMEMNRISRRWASHVYCKLKFTEKYIVAYLGLFHRYLPNRSFIRQLSSAYIGSNPHHLPISFYSILFHLFHSINAHHSCFMLRRMNKSNKLSRLTLSMRRTRYWYRFESAAAAAAAGEETWSEPFGARTGTDTVNPAPGMHNIWRTPLYRIP